MTAPCGFPLIDGALLVSPTGGGVALCVRPPSFESLRQPPIPIRVVSTAIVKYFEYRVFISIPVRNLSLAATERLSNRVPELKRPADADLAW